MTTEYEIDSADIDRKATAETLQREVTRLERELRRFTDDTCYGRCDNPDGLRSWFTHETRGLLHPEEAHEVLDMVLNKIGADWAAHREAQS